MRRPERGAVAACAVSLLLLLGVLTVGPADVTDPVHATGGGALPPTVVSITFDDGWAGQARAGRVLADRGLRATFYVSSGLLGRPGYLGPRGVRELVAQGHEIGGHTVDHVDLVEAGDARLRRQVCADRRRLQALGTAVTSFAYPYGSWDDRVVAAVRDCGYRSARLASGLRGRGTGCGDCPLAESFRPLTHRFDVRTHLTVRRDDTWRDLAALIRRVEQQGGWVPLVLHRVCDGCAEESTSPRTLRRLADWLVERPSTTTVRPVAGVVAEVDRRERRAATTTDEADPTAAEPTTDDPAEELGAADAPPAAAPPADEALSASDGQAFVLVTGTLVFLLAVVTFRVLARQERPAHPRRRRRVHG